MKMRLACVIGMLILAVLAIKGVSSGDLWPVYQPEHSDCCIIDSPFVEEYSHEAITLEDSIPTPGPFYDYIIPVESGDEVVCVWGIFDAELFLVSSDSRELTIDFRGGYAEIIGNVSGKWLLLPDPDNPGGNWIQFEPVNLTEVGRRGDCW